MTAAASPPPAAASPPTSPAGQPGRTPAPTGTGTLARASMPHLAPPREPSTPRLLRILLTVTMLALVLFTGATAWAVASTEASLARSVATADQVDRVQRMRVEVLRSNAAAATDQLAGAGREVRSHAEPLASARGLVVEASAFGPDDRADLVAVNGALDDYAAQLELARLERGTPDGQTALLRAGVLLNDRVLPGIDRVVDTNNQRIDGDAARLPLVIVAVTGGIAVICLVGISFVLLNRFRRVVNLGTTAATVLVLVPFVLSLTVLGQADQATSQAAQNDIPALAAAADARRFAYGARTQESLILLTRPTEPTLQNRWNDYAARANQAAENVPATSRNSDLAAQWRDYSDAFGQVRRTYEAGRWDEARALAIGPAPVTTTAEHFTAFDRAATGEMEFAIRRARTNLGDSRSFLTVAAVLTLLGGTGAVACTAAGIRPRLREYR